MNDKNSEEVFTGHFEPAAHSETQMSKRKFVQNEDTKFLE